MKIRSQLAALALLLVVVPPNGDVLATGATTPRPAVIAIIEPPPLASLDEFAIDPDLRAALMESAQIPDGPRVSHLGLQGTTLATQRFHRLDHSRIVGLFVASETGEQEAVVSVTEHSTQVAGRVVGATTGSCGTCLVVHVTGSMSRGLAWIYHQDWIDAVSISVNAPYDDLSGITEAVRAITDSGRPVFTANGNTLIDHPAYARASALWNSDAITVTATSESGPQDAHGLPPGADLATWGLNAPVPSLDGTVIESSGTSFAAPWMAGQYGRILAEAWQAGWLERVSDGTTVRQRIVGVAGEGTYAADGYLDGPEVLRWLAGKATFAYGFTPNHPFSVDPSFWLGYGTLVDSEFSALSSGPAAMLEPDQMGPGHALNRAQRQASATAAIEANKAWCAAAKILVPNIYCADHWLKNNDWFE